MSLFCSLPIRPAFPSIKLPYWQGANAARLWRAFAGGTASAASLSNAADNVADASIAIRRGTTLKLDWTLYQGARTGAPRNLTGAAFSNVSDAWVGLPNPVVTVLDAAAGKIRTVWTAAQTRSFGEGRVQRFELGVAWPNGDEEVLPPLWIVGQ